MMPKPAAETAPRPTRGLPPLLSSCALGLALAAIAPGGAAQAQVHAVQSSGNVVAGSAEIDATGGTLAAPRTDVFLGGTVAVIDWTPSDSSTSVTTAIDFLPANGTLSFNASSEFTVLNRVLTPTSRAIGLNGSVQGLIEDSIQPRTGGNIWFYSPTGIIAGSGSSFAADGLILTANDIPFLPGPNGGIDYGSSGEILFAAAPGSQARVVLEPGALISNTGTSAYTLLVAPGITQGGTIAIDGSVGLVAAERATVIVQNSLFDIAVEIGTSVVDAIVHSGSTGQLPSDSIFSGPQKVVVMATPQNTAITVLLEGDLGAVATNAVSADRAVIISGAHDYNDLTSTGLAANPVTTTPVNVEIGTASFNAELTALTTGSIDASPSRGTTLAFLENASLTAAGAVTITADLDETITAAQDLFVQGNASAVLRLGTTNSESGSGTDAATVDIGGNLTLSASNIGPSSGADGIGGIASILLDAGAPGPSLTVAGSTLVSANGTGRASAGSGGSGFGGTAGIVVNGGTLSLQDVVIQANGLGIDAIEDGSGGDAAGGTAQFVANGGTATMGGLTISANAQGGAGREDGANGDVDSSASVARLVVSGPGTAVTADGVDLSANALSTAGAAPSGSSQAGNVELLVANGGSLTSTFGLSGTARAEWTLADNASHSSVGTTQGGNVTLTVAGGTLNAPIALFDVSAQALRTTGAQGDAVGGTVTVTVRDEQGLEGVAEFASGLFATASADGGIGSSGGNARGGAVSLIVDGGTLTTDDIAIDVHGRAGFRSDATIAGTGGDVIITTQAGGAQAGFTFQTLEIDGSGIANYDDPDIGPIAAGDGARGQGGTFGIIASGATLTGNAISANLGGSGGNADVSDSAADRTTGGIGQGGTFNLLVDGGAVDIGTIEIGAVGIGGLVVDADSSGFAGNPGQGLGGTATITATSGSFANESFALDTSGIGGSGGNGASAGTGSPSGGSGQGGTAALVLGGAQFTTLGGTLLADGFGGNGASGNGTPGGSGTGGLATVTATDALGYALGDLTVSASGTAGNSTGPLSASDGIGTGGTARFVNQGAAAATANSRTVGNLTLRANGDGGVVDGMPGQNAVPGFVQFSDLASGADGRARFANVDIMALGLSAPAGSGVLVESAGGPLTIDQNLYIDSAGTVTVAVTGNGTVAAGGFLAVFSTQGDIVVSHAGQTAPPVPTLTGEDLLLDAQGSLTAGPGTLLAAVNSATLRARTGDVAVASVEAVDEIHVNALGNVFLGNATTTGPFTELSGGELTGGLIDITAGVDPVERVGIYQPADIVIGGTVTASGQLQAHAGRDILGDGLLQGERVVLIGERDIAGANLSIVSRRDLDTLIGRNLLADTVDVAGTVNMVDLDGALVQAGQLNVPGTLTIANLTLRGPTPGLLRAGGALTLGDVRATGLDVATAGGALTIGSLAGFPGGLSGFLTASAPTIALDAIQVTGPLAATATTGSLTANAITAGGTVILAAATDLSAGNVSSGGLLSLAAPGTIAIGGPVSGTSVTASSGDLDIASGSRIGTAGVTTLVELTNSSAAASYYGGADNPGGYSLSAAEIGRLYGDDITLVASSQSPSGSPPPDVTIGAMTVTGRATNAAGQLGTQGAFTIRTSGRVLIGGAVGFTDLGSANRFAIRAGDLIVLDNQSGSVDLRGPNDALSGSIDFAADTIMALSDAARQSLSSLSDPAAIDLLLGANDGPLNDEGALRAGGMLFTVQDGLYIQNTGAGTGYAQRRGFTVGAEGIAISTPSASAGNDSPLIVINGRANDGAAVGLDTIPLVSINGQSASGSGSTRAGSTINGCDFSDVTTCTATSTSAAAQSATLTRDRIEIPVENPGSSLSDVTDGRQALITTAVERDEIEGLAYEPLIDEPVTGSGNDDLWTPDCDPAREGTCAPQPGE